MSTQLKINYEATRKTLFTKEFHKIDALKAKLKDLCLLNSDDFEIYHVHKSGVKALIKIQKDWTSIVTATASEPILELEIKKMGKGNDNRINIRDADEGEKSVVHVIGVDNEKKSDYRDPESSIIIHIQENHQQKMKETTNDSMFVDIHEDDDHTPHSKDQMNFNKNNKRKENTDFEFEPSELEGFKDLSFPKSDPLFVKPTNDKLESENKALNEENTRLKVLVEELRSKLKTEEEKCLEYRKTVALEKKKLEEQYSKPMFERPKNNGVVHTGITCNRCKLKGFSGVRYTCIECKNYDLCQDCEREPNIHSHLMIRVCQKVDRLAIEVKKAVTEGCSEAFGPIRDIIEKQMEDTQLEKETKERIMLLKNVLGITDPKKIDDLIAKYGSFNKDQFIEKCLTG